MKIKFIFNHKMFIRGTIFCKASIFVGFLLGMVKKKTKKLV